MIEHIRPRVSERGKIYHRLFETHVGYVSNMRYAYEPHEVVSLGLEHFNNLLRIHYDEYIHYKGNINDISLMLEKIKTDFDNAIDKIRPKSITELNPDDGFNYYEALFKTYKSAMDYVITRPESLDSNSYLTYVIRTLKLRVKEFKDGARPIVFRNREIKSLDDKYKELEKIQEDIEHKILVMKERMQIDID